MNDINLDRRRLLQYLYSGLPLFLFGTNLFHPTAVSASGETRTATPIHVPQLHSGHSLTNAAMARGSGRPSKHYEQLLNSVGRSTAKVQFYTVPGSTMKYRAENKPHSWNELPNYEVVSVTERNDTYPLEVFGTRTGWINKQRKERRQSMRDWLERSATLGNGGDGADFFFYTPWVKHTNYNAPEKSRKLVEVNNWRERLAYDEVEFLDIADHAEAEVPGGAKVWIIPGNAMMMRLWDDAEAGAIPDIANGKEFLASPRWWKDDVHPDHLGSLALAYLHMYVIHHIDPRGTAYKGFDMEIEPSQAEATYMQNMIYDLVQNYPRAGVA